MKQASIKNESQLNVAIRAALNTEKSWRFEPGTPVGMPDIHWLREDGHSGWIESKFEVDDVRPQQAIFLREYAAMGGRAHVVVIRHRHLWVLPARFIRLDRTLDFHSATPGANCGEVGSINWGQFRAELFCSR